MLKLTLRRPVLGLLRVRSCSTSVDAKMRDMLTTQLQATQCKVTDISGGCGAMFDVFVESSMFKGKSMVAQHKMVTSILKNEIKDMHGLTIKTKTP